MPCHSPAEWPDNGSARRCQWRGFQRGLAFAAHRAADGSYTLRVTRS
jgi:hypothetical protein